MHALFYTIFVNSRYINLDPQLVQNQEYLLENKQQEAKNIPDPVFSGNLDEGSVIRDRITFNIENNLSE